MIELKLEWDRTKDKANVRSMASPYEEARTVFFDEEAIQFLDPDHSDDEDRSHPSRPQLEPKGPCCLPLLSRKRNDYPHHFGENGGQGQRKVYWRRRR